AAMLPSWAGEGGPEATLARLADPAETARIRHTMEVEGSDGCHGVPIEWDTIEISGVSAPELEPYVGRTIADSAAERGEEPFAVAHRLLVADRLGTAILQHVGHEENVRTIMRHPVHTAGSDGLLQAAKPHPRAYGTFPRYLGHYSRDLGLLTLEECVAHLTPRPAARLRLPDRGLIREGHRADLVLFDPDTVADTATFDDPRSLPEGIPHVLVSGRPVIRDGRRTAVLAGRSVRRTPVSPLRGRRPVRLRRSGGFAGALVAAPGQLGDALVGDTEGPSGVADGEPPTGEDECCLLERSLLRGLGPLSLLACLLGCSDGAGGLLVLWSEEDIEGVGGDVEQPGDRIPGHLLGLGPVPSLSESGGVLRQVVDGDGPEPPVPCGGRSEDGQRSSCTATVRA